MVISSSAWGSVEGHNLRGFILNQIDFLIDRVDRGEPYDRQTQKTFVKIEENLEALSNYIQGNLRREDFERVSNRLNNAAKDWNDAQLTDVRLDLHKGKMLLASFAF